MTMTTVLRYLPAWLWLVCLLTADGSLGASAVGCKASLPSEIRWIVPNTTGSNYDRYSRVLEPYLEDALETRIVINNVPGAGGRLGAVTIADASSDGSVLGIVNGVSLLANQLVGSSKNLPTIGSFQVLYRINRVGHVWVVANGSGLETIAKILEAGRSVPIVVATRDVSSSSFYSLAIGAELLGLPIEVVAGYASNREARLALLRGEVDLASMNFETGVGMLESEELKAVLQISSYPLAQHPTLADVPMIAGDNGILASTRYSASDDPETRALGASVLTRFLGAGQLIVGPKYLDTGVRACIEQALHSIVPSSSLRDALQKIGRSVDSAPAPVVESELEQVLEASAVLSSAILEQLERLRR